MSNTIQTILDMKKEHKGWLVMDTRNNVVLASCHLWDLNGGRVIQKWTLTYDEGTDIIATKEINEYYYL